jgi:hypothetical protein
MCGIIGLAGLQLPARAQRQVFSEEQVFRGELGA